MLNGGAVSWKSRRQDCVSLSTSEAEYVAAGQCGQEVYYMREILRDFGYAQTAPTHIYQDNLACVAMSENPVRRKFLSPWLLALYAVLSGGADDDPSLFLSLPAVTGGVISPVATGRVSPQ
jgi:hypothetical protein